MKTPVLVIVPPPLTVQVPPEVPVLVKVTDPCPRQALVVVTMDIRDNAIAVEICPPQLPFIDALNSVPFCDAFGVNV